MELAKAVASATANLVLKSKNVAGTVQEDEIRNHLIGDAANCALNTSQLVAVTKVTNCYNSLQFCVKIKTECILYIFVAQIN